MTKKCKVLCSILAVGMLGMAGASATIVVDFDPWYAYIDDVGLTTNIDIIADIPEEDAILGWGLDVIVDDPGIADMTNVTINTLLFNAVDTPDGDGLGGLCFPDCVWGDDVLLATIEFTGYAIGMTPIWTWDDNPDDLTEGFALCTTGFAEVSHASGFVEVPEPASLTLLAFCGLVALRRR